MSQAVSSPLYAAIDLGSNSFHMLVVRHIDGSVQTMAKIKRKVRLAAGLDEHNALSLDAMQRGWDCLSLFAERLQDIPAENIRIVGTATLRTATNAGEFIAKANQILGHPIDVISGEEEAATIYKGVAHTSGGLGRRLVVDIGGASTELIIGEGFEAKALTSLKMGCVTWLERHFKDRQLTATNFNNAILAAKQMLDPILTQYTELGWNVCVGASGTVQALQEIMLAQGMDEVITLTKLKRLQKQAMLADHLEELDIEGLTLERALVFPSGLSILIAIFESLNIEAMTLAGGALREVSSMRWFKTYAKKIFERAPFAAYKPVISSIALMVIKSLLSPVNCSHNVAVKPGSMNHKQRCCCVRQLSCMKLVSPSISKKGGSTALTYSNILIYPVIPAPKNII